MPTILITGSNRGIGKSLCELYRDRGWNVIATSRDTTKNPVENVQKESLDICDAASLLALKKRLSGVVIDVLWNNAGVLLERDPQSDYQETEKWLKTFHANTIAPLQVAQALKENVLSSERKIFAFTSSRVGSIEENDRPYYSYSSSKAALNMTVTIFGREVEERGGSALVLHPGWVKTDMGGEEAPLSSQESAKEMANLIDSITPKRQSEFNGAFYNYDGTTIRW